MADGSTGPGPEAPITPRGVATAESLREQPSATEPVAPVGGTVTETGELKPIQVQGGGPLPDTGGSILGGFFKKLNPFK